MAVCDWNCRTKYLANSKFSAPNLRLPMNTHLQFIYYTCVQVLLLQHSFTQFRHTRTIEGHSITIFKIPVPLFKQLLNICEEIQLFSSTLSCSINKIIPKNRSSWTGNGTSWSLCLIRLVPSYTLFWSHSWTDHFQCIEL